MTRAIVWSPLSKQDFLTLLEYLKENWDDKVVQGFIKIVDSSLVQISRNPGQFPVIYREKEIRKCVLTKHNSLYYRYGEDFIEILRMYDNRQDPKKLVF